MGTRIFIDIGGTFADCAVWHEGRLVTSKRPASPDRPGEVVIRALEGCADELQMSLRELLCTTEEIGYSSTAALNQLVARQGPRLGLLATAGAEDAIYVGMGAQWVDGVHETDRGTLLPKARKPVPLIPRELCVGILERIDSRGQIVRPLNEDQIRREVRRLVEEEVQGFVVSFLWSFINPCHERRVREIIREEYPENLFNFPVVLSSDSASVRGEYQRTMTAVINLYVMSTMREQLSGVLAELRRNGFAGRLSIVQNHAGLADIWTTAPVSVFKGGPAAGLMGARCMVKKYGDKIITTDMGGTTFDVGIICEDEPLPGDLRPVIDRWLIGGNMLEVTSIGAGSGTVFRVRDEKSGQLEMLTLNAGAVPGPAAYGLGASEPTLLDADLLLGYLDPDNFSGGTRKLSRDRAQRAIYEKIAQPLGISVTEAAARMRKMADEWMGHTLLTETVKRGYDPRQFTVFAYGGAGPTHCCDYTRALSPKRIVTFPFSPVFCAAVSAYLSHSRTLRRTVPYVLMDPQQRWTSRFDEFNEIVKQMEEESLKSLEDFDETLRRKAEFTLELDMKFGGQVHVKRIVSPCRRIRSLADAERIWEAFIESYKRRFSEYSLYVEGGVMIEAFILHVSLPAHPPELPVWEESPSGPMRALKGRREVYWVYENAWMSTPVYRFELLGPGNLIEGPAIIESGYTTWVIPMGYRFTLDWHKAGLIERI